MTDHALSQGTQTQVQLIDFDPPQVIEGTPAQDAEPPQIAAYNENVLILWHELPTNNATALPDVFISWSTQGGRDFKPRVNLSNSSGDSRDEDIAVVAQATWNVFVVWVEGTAGQTDVLLRRAKKDGDNFKFEAAGKVNAGGGEQEASRAQVIARRGSNDNVDVYVVWQALQEDPANPAKNSIDIFSRESHDSGASFNAAPKNISNTPPDLNDPNRSRENSEAPQTTLTSSGRVVVTWRDSSLQGKGFEIFAAPQR